MKRINKGDKVLLPDGTKGIVDNFLKIFNELCLFVKGNDEPYKVSECKLIEYEIGEEITVEMIKSEKGNRPFCRTPKGMVALVKFDLKGFWEVGSVWICKIVEIFEKKVIIEPLVEVRTKGEQEKHKAELLTAYVKENMHVKRPCKEKIIKKYQFQSKNEQSKSVQTINEEII